MADETEIEVRGVTPQRFAEIKRIWVGKRNDGLARRGNEAYRQVGELIDGYDRLERGVSRLLSFLAANPNVQITVGRDTMPQHDGD